MKSKNSLKTRLYEIIFEADTPAGKSFDVFLLLIILLSVAVVLLESVPKIEQQYGPQLHLAEWIITIIFTLEYIVRIGVILKPSRYIFSFYGIIDLLAVIPTYLAIVFAGAQGLVIIRALRFFRIFRIFKLTRYTSEGATIIKALKASKTKISVFLFAVLTIVLVIGTVMYLIEGGESGFTSIPKGIYWAIVTLTTVGYGDIAPITALGQLLASCVMILGYAIIAVPTGIVTAEFSQAKRETATTQVCPHCIKEGHETDAVFCKFCGKKLNE